jgi:hypothetical protein
MTTMPARCRIRRRSILTFVMLALGCAVLLGAAQPQPAAAGISNGTRLLHISVSKPTTVVTGSTVTMRCRARDQAGKAIKGVRVTFRWYLADGVVTQRRVTNAQGLASASRLVDCGSSDSYDAQVVVTARWHGQVKRVTRSFTIAGGT